MKTQKFLLIICLTIGLCMPLAAQIEVQGDGGVKIGQKPSGGWTLTSKGFELASGDLLFHASGGGKLQIAGKRMPIVSGNNSGASLTLKAGEKVVLGKGFKIEEGGTLCVTGK